MIWGLFFNSLSYTDAQALIFGDPPNAPPGRSAEVPDLRPAGSGPDDNDGRLIGTSDTSATDVLRSTFIGAAFAGRFPVSENMVGAGCGVSGSGVLLLATRGCSTWLIADAPGCCSRSLLGAAGTTLAAISGRSKVGIGPCGCSAVPPALATKV